MANANSKHLCMGRSEHFRSQCLKMKIEVDLESLSLQAGYATFCQGPHPKTRHATYIKIGVPDWKLKDHGYCRYIYVGTVPDTATAAWRAFIVSILASDRGLQHGGRRFQQVNNHLAATHISNRRYLVRNDYRKNEPLFQRGLGHI